MSLPSIRTASETGEHGRSADPERSPQRQLPEIPRSAIASALGSFGSYTFDRIEERVLARPNGGSGDSCVVSRLTVHLSPPRTSSSSSTTSPEAKKQRFVKQLIVKRVLCASERHAERDPLKTEIKRISYKVEGFFLDSCVRLSAGDITVPLAMSRFWSSSSRDTSLLIEDDLVERGYTYHDGEVSIEHALLAMDWLAAFHSIPLAKWKGDARIWGRGGYWSLEKRSEEFCRMEARYKRILRNQSSDKEFSRLSLNLASRLRNSAESVDQLLHPNCKPIPFDRGEERNAYGNCDTSDDESQSSLDDRMKNRRALARKLFHVVTTISSDLDKGHEYGGKSCAFLKPTVLHGDFKAENVFFSNNGCAVCDFQWTGFGLGVLDVVSFVCTSISPSDITNHTVGRLLDRYCHAIRAYCPSSQSFDDDRRILRIVFDWAIVDYARYIVGTGYVYPEDAPILVWADRTLNIVDSGKVIKGREYHNHIHAVLRKHFKTRHGEG